MSNTAAPIYELLARPLADLRVSRSRFEAFFNDWLEFDTPSVDASEQPKNFIHAVWSSSRLCAEVNPKPRLENTTDAVRLALAALGSKDTAYGCVVAAIAAGIFDPENAKDGLAVWRKSLSQRVLAEFGDHSPRAVRQALSSREVLVDKLDFWTDLGHILPAITVARRRLCRIEICDQNSFEVIKRGTGFLVGPSKLLTNLHVVDSLPDAIPDTEVRKACVRLRFDYSETTGRKTDTASTFHLHENWCLARGGLGDQSHEGPAEDYWWDNGTKRVAWLSLVADTLDYAVLQIDGTPGLQRGWYRLSTDDISEPIGVWAMHHPTIDEQTITRGPVPISASVGGGGARLFHAASTTTGSSGGLILNENGEPAALHYLGLQAEAEPDPDQSWQKNERINVAIPLPLIAKALKEEGVLDRLEDVSAIRPYRGCLDGKQPVFGRVEFLDKLHEFWTNDRRILRVDLLDQSLKGRRPGKTFSGSILEGVFKGPEHHHIRFSAADIKVDALRVASDALATFAEDLVPNIPADPDTTSPAYVRRLVTFFANAMRDRLPNHNVWIVLDDLDQYDLSDASGREFLATLYNQVSSMPFLRIVLIGLPADAAISGMKDEDVMTTFITSDEIDNLGALLTDWLKQRGARDANITDEGFKLIERMLVSYAGDETPLERAAAFAQDHLSDVAEDMFGSALSPQEDGT